MEVIRYFGRCERHAKLLSSGFHMLAKSVFVFWQRTMPHNSGLVVSSSIKHKCSQCHKSYARLYTLRVHEATHRGRYPYWFNVCGKDFSATSSLRGHMAHHTGVAEFKCHICGRRFRYPQDYKRHIQNNHSEIDS